MFKYFLLLMLVLFLTSCSTIAPEEEMFVATPSLPAATVDTPLVIEDTILLPLGGSKNISIRFFNIADETTVGFGTGLYDKATIICFGLEGENVNMVLRASPVSFASAQEKELEILLEDKSRSTRAKKFTCTLQFYNGFGDVFQEDFDVVLV